MKQGRVFLLLAVLAADAAPAQERRGVDIWSEGTRIAGDLWFPAGLAADASAPAVLMSHGWGGTRDHLNSAYARDLARAGFAVLTIDYRGWGGSDSRLVLVGPEPAPGTDGTVTARVRPIREVVDPQDQILDIANAFAFLVGEPRVDATRIGVWGTSYSGGLAIAFAAREPRVAAVVAQVGYMGAGGSSVDRGHRRATEKARGEIAPIPQGIDEVPGLRGTPDLAKMVGWRPIDVAVRVRAPTLIIDVDKEELFDRRANGRAVFEVIRANAVAEYEIYPGRHYDIYRRHRRAALDRAIGWFRVHLRERAWP